MLDKIPKKIAIINDITGFGRCSMAVALPVISACKVQACPVPTSVFTNHTAFDSFYSIDLTDSLSDYFEQWEQLSLEFDGFICGYLGSISQLDIISDYFERIQASEQKTIYIVDPVMGDNGKVYKKITDEFCSHMKHLVKKATIITPNITEACLLTDTPYQVGPWHKSDLQLIAEKLHKLGPEKIVITGIQDDAHYHNFIYESGKPCTLQSNTIAGESRHGTGDIFTSILSAFLVRGFSLGDSVRIAADFIATVIAASSKANVPVKEGVIIENYLGLLTAL